MNSKVVMGFFIASLLSSCFQVQNSFESDKDLYQYRPALDLGDPAQLRLQKVREVFTRNNCVSCHSERIGFKAFLSFTDSDWTTKSCGQLPCVVAGKPADSYLYKKINSAACTPSDLECNMPSQSLPMAPADVALIEEWIEEL